MEIVFDTAWKGFKSVLARIEKQIKESKSEAVIEIIFESDDTIQEFTPDELPTGEVIKELFEDSDIIKATVIVNERPKHKQVLKRKKQVEKESKKEVVSDRSNFDLGREMAEQVKVFLTVSEQVNNSRMNSIQSGFEMMMGQMKSAYDKREEIFMDLSKRDRELIYKEAETNSKKKYDTIETIFNLLAGGAEKAFKWIDENPEKAAEVVFAWRSGGAKQV